MEKINYFNTFGHLLLFQNHPCPHKSPRPLHWRIVVRRVERVAVRVVRRVVGAFVERVVRAQDDIFAGIKMEDVFVSKNQYFC